MSVNTYEAIVRNGHVQLPEHISLPENTRVYVVVPDESIPMLRSPRLVDPSQSADFEKQIVREGGHA